MKFEPDNIYHVFNQGNNQEQSFEIVYLERRADKQENNTCLTSPSDKYCFKK
jgi:hypothetical protein